jgi:hypothetical protein
VLSFESPEFAPRHGGFMRAGSIQEAMLFAHANKRQHFVI